MSFRELYKFRQGLDSKVGRNEIIAKVADLKKIAVPRVMKTTLDTTKCRGFYLSARNIDHPFVKMHGTTVIVLARGLNYCWDRAVLLKELMHIWDDPSEAVDTGATFEQQLTGMGLKEFDSKPARAEYMCIWKALLLFCREDDRQALLKEEGAGPADTYSIALKLRMPEFYVPLLLGDSFEKVKRMLAE